MRKRVTGKDLNDPKVRADLVKTGQKFKSQEVKAGVDRLLQGVPSEQRDLFTDTKREPDATGDRERDAVNISSVESTAVGEDTAVVTGTDGRTVGDVGGSTFGQPTTGTGTEPDTLTEQDIEARKYAELGALLEKEVRTSKKKLRLTELVSEAKAGFARRQKPPEDTREASLEFEEGAVTEEQAAIDARQRHKPQSLVKL